MTTTEKDRGNIADLMHALRPDFDIAGCIAPLRKLDLPLGAVIIAAVRYAQDPANLTPAHLADFTNRAWDDDWHLPCPRHPEQSRRHTSGECASCRADRTGAIEPPPPRQPTPPPRPLRELVNATRRPATPTDATTGATP
jgi:hypothetical protein